jgi:outer membrane protein assembly factor BamB
VGISGWLNSPIVVGNTVVIGSAGTRRAGSDPGDGVHALDLRTGAERWFFPATSDVNGVAARGDLVVATGDEGTVWGLDITTGSLRWSFSTTTPVFTNPLVVDDLIIVGDASGVVRALDLRGQQRWWVRLDGAIRGGAASDGQVIYAVSERGDAVALSTDGFELWRSRIEYSSTAWGRPEGAPALPVTVFAAPTVDRDHLVVSFVVDGGPSGPAVVALDRFVGTLMWWSSDPNDVHRGTNVRTSPARYGDVLVLASSLSAGIHAVDSVSGQVLWATESGVQCTRQWASPVVLGDSLVVPRPDGALHAYDAGTGETVWRFVPSAGGEFPPAAGCTGGGGRVQDGFELQASVAVAPDGTLIVASMSQFVFAIGES